MQLHVYKFFVIYYIAYTLRVGLYETEIHPEQINIWSSR